MKQLEGSPYALLLDVLRSVRKQRYLSELMRNAHLTQREREVVSVYLECPNRRLASERLSVSPRTYDAHVRSILHKTTHRSMEALFRESMERIDPALLHPASPGAYARVSDEPAAGLLAQGAAPFDVDRSRPD